MRIKKLPNKQVSFKLENLWVADPLSCKKPLDLNKIEHYDKKIFIDNEILNSNYNFLYCDNKDFNLDKVIIISDGMEFDQYHKELYKINKKTKIIAVNKSLRKWKLVGDSCENEKKRAIDYYFVNNPYEECSFFMPTEHKYFPNCIASSRTNNKFVKNYLGDLMLYSPSKNFEFSGLKRTSNYTIQDYRNPILGALDFCLKNGAKQISLLCCDDSKKENLAGMEEINKEIYSYPHHKKISEIIDLIAKLSKEYVKFYDCSSSIDYSFIEKVSIENIIENN